MLVEIFNGKKTRLHRERKNQKFFESNERNGNQTDWNSLLRKIPVRISSVVKFHAQSDREKEREGGRREKK